MKKLIDFSEKVSSMVKEIIEREGHKTFSGAIHSIISQYYRDEYFNKYKIGVKSSAPGVEAPPEPKIMTRATICEFFGGDVDMNNLLGRSCISPIDRAGVKRKLAPLISMGIVSQYGDYTIDGVEVVDGY